MNLARDQILVERRYVAVFETIADDVVSSLAVALPENLRDALARTVALPRGAFDETSTLAQRLRQGMVARKAIIDTGVLLSNRAPSGSSRSSAIVPTIRRTTTCRDSFPRRSTSSASTRCD